MSTCNNLENLTMLPWKCSPVSGNSFNNFRSPKNYWRGKI